VPLYKDHARLHPRPNWPTLQRRNHQACLEQRSLSPSLSNRHLHTHTIIFTHGLGTNGEKFGRIIHRGEAHKTNSRGKVHLPSLQQASIQFISPSINKPVVRHSFLRGSFSAQRCTITSSGLFGEVHSTYSGPRDGDDIQQEYCAERLDSRICNGSSSTAKPGVSAWWICGHEWMASILK
jgi:hypothetical protein